MPSLAPTCTFPILNPHLTPVWIPSQCLPVFAPTTMPSGSHPRLSCSWPACPQVLLFGLPDMTYTVCLDPDFITTWGYRSGWIAGLTLLLSMTIPDPWTDSPCPHFIITEATPKALSCDCSWALCLQYVWKWSQRQTCGDFTATVLGLACVQEQIYSGMFLPQNARVTM